MILSFGTVNIKVDKFESYEALDDALALCEAGSMYAGQKRGTENAWNMIAVTDAETGEYFGIGLLTSDFVDFIYIQERRSVIIVHKKGVIVKDNECKELWRHSAGLISGYSIEGDLFIMEREDGEEIALKLKNGREVELADR